MQNYCIIFKPDSVSFFYLVVKKQNHKLKNACDIFIFHSAFPSESNLRYILLNFILLQRRAATQPMKQQTSSKFVRTIRLQYIELNQRNVGKHFDFSEIFADLDLLGNESLDQLKPLSLH